MSLKMRHFPPACFIFEDLSVVTQTTVHLQSIFSTGQFQQFDKEGSGVAEMNITEVSLVFGFKKMNIYMLF